MAVSAQAEVISEIANALGIGKLKLTSYDLRVRLDDAVRGSGTGEQESVTVDFEHILEEDQLKNIRDTLRLNMQHAFLVAADWLEERGHDDAAAALRGAEL